MPRSANFIAQYERDVPADGGDLSHLFLRLLHALDVPELHLGTGLLRRMLSSRPSEAWEMQMITLTVNLEFHGGCAAADTACGIQCELFLSGT